MIDIGRTDGYAPIDSYAVLGDGRTVALVARDGSIDWLPIPVLDAPPAFAALLDPDTGGRFELAPAVPAEVERAYRADTAVLETRFRTAGGSVTVTDSLNRQGERPLPWIELARVVRAEGGEVPMRWRIAPGRRWGAAEPWVQDRGGVPFVRLADESMAVVTRAAGDVRTDAHAVAGDFVARPGTDALIALVATDDEPVLVPDAGEILARVERTGAGWREWRRRLSYHGPHADAVVRSALVLRLLTIDVQGANAAAATTSLPEKVGGRRNYDYRFCWVRDASFALDALTSLGLLEEVHSSLSWLLHAVARTAPHLHVFYTLSGQPAQPDETRVESLRGYLGSAPVNVGNSAASQRQLGCYGDLLDAVARYVRHGGHLDGRSAAMLAGLTHHACDVWRLPDAGLWELNDYQHYTASKISCWAALDRAVWLAEVGELPSWQADRWRAARQEVHEWVNRHCWSPARQAYVMHPGSDDLDAAVLLAARFGFAAHEPDRYAATVAACQRDLDAGAGLLYRYSSMRGREGAFVACSFWLVDGLGACGRGEEARALFEAMLRHANDVGLFAEEIDPATGHALGNVPQGLSHLALIGAARTVAGG